MKVLLKTIKNNFKVPSFQILHWKMKSFKNKIAKMKRVQKVIKANKIKINFSNHQVLSSKFLMKHKIDQKILKKLKATINMEKMKI